MFVGITAMYAFQQPPFFDADEKAHLGYAHEIADFDLPEITEQPDVPSSAVQWQAERASGRDDRYRAVWVANHPPLHYVAVAPLTRAAEATDRPDGGLLLTRLANLSFAAVGIVLTYLLAVELSSGRRRVALAAAAIVALVPQGHVYFSRGLNDGLAFAAGTGVLWAGVRCLTRHRPDPTEGEPRGTYRDLVLLGVMSAIAAGARTATMLLAVLVVGGVAMHRLLSSTLPLRQRVRDALTSTAIGLGPAAALFGWFYVRIQLLYGDIGASSFLLDRFGREPRGSVLDLMTDGRRWVHMYQRMTSTAPLSWAWPRFANLIAVLILVGLAVVVITRRTGSDESGRRGVIGIPSLLMTFASVGLITFTVALHLAGGGSTYPRYFFPVLGVLAALAALATDRLLPRLLPTALIVAMFWWAIRQLPIGVDPATEARPRDRGGVAPQVLQVLPVGEAWRVVAAALIAAGACIAAVCIGASLVPWRRGEAT